MAPQQDVYGVSHTALPEQDVYGVSLSKWSNWYCVK